MKRTLIPAMLLSILFAAACNKDNTTLTSGPPYYPQVKATIQTYCVSCHVSGGQGMPVFLDSDSNIVMRAEGIKRATNDTLSPMNRKMPPTADLTDAQKAAILNWFNAGGRMSD